MPRIIEALTWKHINTSTLTRDNMAGQLSTPYTAISISYISHAMRTERPCPRRKKLLRTVHFLKPCVGLDMTCAWERSMCLTRPGEVLLKCSPLHPLSVAEEQLAPKQTKLDCTSALISGFTARLWAPVSHQTLSLSLSAVHATNLPLAYMAGPCAVVPFMVYFYCSMLLLFGQAANNLNIQICHFL